MPVHLTTPSCPASYNEAPPTAENEAPLLSPVGTLTMSHWGGRAATSGTPSGSGPYPVGTRSRLFGRQLVGARAPQVSENGEKWGAK
jgi:hypothetical protein